MELDLFIYYIESLGFIKATYVSNCDYDFILDRYRITLDKISWTDEGDMRGDSYRVCFWQGSGIEMNYDIHHIDTLEHLVLMIDKLLGVNTGINYHNANVTRYISNKVNLMKVIDRQSKINDIIGD